MLFRLYKLTKTVWFIPKISSPSPSDHCNLPLPFSGGGALPGDFFEKPQPPKKGILKNAPARPTYAPKPVPSARLERSDTSQHERMDTEDSGLAPSQPAGKD